MGNPGDVRFVGAGVSELRIDYGPGYRVYLMRRRPQLSCYSAVAIRAHRTVTSGAPKSWRKKTEMALETLPCDPAEHLKIAEEVRDLEAAFEGGDPH